MRDLCISVDYGQMNATTYECFGFDYKDICVRGVDEYYYSGRDTGKQKSPNILGSNFSSILADSINFLPNHPSGTSLKSVCI